MRIKLVMSYLSKVSMVIGISMLLPILCSLKYGSDDLLALLISMLIALGVGLLLFVFFRNKKNEALRHREGFALVTFSWILAAILGACPYLLSGHCPDFVDAFFESMSGFTTTGASIFSDVEALPMGILMWRSLTQWLGGMGIVVLLLVFVSGSGVNNIYKAEAPGNSLMDKLTPKVGDASQILWVTYCILTITLIGLLKFGGMGFFDAICHTFATLSTGGFSTKNASMGYFDSAYLQWVVTLFMFLSGSNIAYFYVTVIKRKNAFLKSEEFRVYLLINVAVISVISINLLLNNIYENASVEYVVRQAAFQTVSLMSTTGFATTNFDLWPSLSKVLLFFLFFIGGCTGSTSGSMKVGRVIVACKNSLVEFAKLVHPKVIKSIKINNKTVSAGLTLNVLQFIVLFFFLFIVGSVVLASQGLNMVEAFSAAATCLGNVGPGFESVGPVSNFSGVTDLGKFVLSILMVIGRLELYTVLVLFVPSFWRK